PSAESVSRGGPPALPRPVRRTIGRSDQGSWASRQEETVTRAARSRTSTARRRAAAPARASSQRRVTSGITSAAIPDSSRTSAAITPSWPQGASTRTRSSRGPAAFIRSFPQHLGPGLLRQQTGLTRQDALEVGEGGPDRHPGGAEDQLADGLLVG